MRNNIVDFIRGMAMTFVVLQHTISGTVYEYSNSVLFQAIWTIQMPLFIIISGYITRYSHPISDIPELCKFVKKRSIAYLLPWFVWTVVVRGLICGQSDFINFKHLLWHMDSGYWFLTTIWTISMIFGISEIVSNKLCKSKSMNILSHIVVSVIGALGIVGVGYFTGMSFFAFKLTLYYLPIYLIGYLYGQMQDYLISKAKADTFITYAIAISLGIWLTIINRFDFLSSSDNISMIALRFATSILGCISIIGLFISICKKRKFKLINWIGVHSLEIYLTNYLFLNLVPILPFPTLLSMHGACSIFINFILTLSITIITIKVLIQNKILNYLLYAKK